MSLTFCSQSALKKTATACLQGMNVPPSPARPLDTSSATVFPQPSLPVGTKEEGLEYRRPREGSSYTLCGHREVNILPQDWVYHPGGGEYKVFTPSLLSGCFLSHGPQEEPWTVPSHGASCSAHTGNGQAKVQTMPMSFSVHPRVVNA